MKRSLTLLFVALGSILYPAKSFAQGTAFTYQGRLNDGANAANGSYDLRFALYDAASTGAAQGNAQTNVATAVSNGLFTVTLDFGNQFPGADRWLEIAVRTNGNGAFTTLTPRQALTATPYAATAGKISGVLAASQLPASVVTNGAAISGTFTGNGANVTNVDAATLGGVSSAGFWKTNGNTGANPTNGAFLGTADKLPLEFKVNGQRALRLEPNDSSPNVVGGFAGNIISNGVAGVFIGGGGSFLFPNRVGAVFATVLGGRDNTASGADSTAMGVGSTASGSSSTAMGSTTTASGDFSTAMGGYTSAISNYSTAMGLSTTASGGVSTAMGSFTTASGGGSTAMGFDTTASGDFSTVLGYSSEAGGTTSLAMGTYAHAAHDNAFVWSDGSAGIFTSTATNQFLIRASGGVGINTNNPNGAALSVAGTTRLSGNVSVIGNLAAGAVSSASGFAAQALGYNAQAPGNYSLAFGNSATAIGALSLAAGYQATAAHQGAFVWSDSSAFPFASTADNQFLIRASGGVGIGTTTPGRLLQVGDPVVPNSQGMMRFASRSGTGGAFRSWDIGVPETDEALSGTGYSFVIDDQQLAGTEFMIKFDTGRVGIGTTTPGSQLEVTGGIRARGGAPGALGANNNGYAFNGNGGDNDSGMFSSADGQIEFYANSAEVMRVKQSGVGIGTSTPVSALQVVGTVTATAFNPPSDRNLKENFAPVSPGEVLEKVAGLAISRWNFIGDDATPHVGPMAQDFHAAFGLGTDERHIATVDADGVALAAIQGLNQKVEAAQRENAALKERVEMLEQLLRKLVK